MSAHINEVYIDVITIKVSTEFFYPVPWSKPHWIGSIICKVERAISLLELMLSDVLGSSISSVNKLLLQWLSSL
jgi:hypothetical protein